jgi:uncharacterized membrane protein
MKQQPKPKQTNPLVLSVFGLMLVVFGSLDIIFNMKVLGIILLFAGFILVIYGIQRYRAIKANLRSKQQK